MYASIVPRRKSTSRASADHCRTSSRSSAEGPRRIPAASAATSAKGGELVLLPQEGLLDQADLPAAYEGSGWIAEFEPGLVLI